MTDLTKEELSELERYGLRFEIINATAPLALEILPTKLANLAAMAKRTEQAERERDALRAIAQEVAEGLLTVNRHDNCLFCGNSVVHRPDCRLIAALAQPTLPTGAASRDAGGV